LYSQAGRGHTAAIRAPPGGLASQLEPDSCRGRVDFQIVCTVCKSAAAVTQGKRKPATSVPPSWRHRGCSDRKITVAFARSAGELCHQAGMPLTAGLPTLLARVKRASATYC